MYDLISILEIFGGTGAVLLGISGCIWKCIQTYDIKFHWWSPSMINEPTQTLDENWETCGNIDESDNFGNSYNRAIFGERTTDNKWKIKMKKGDGNLLIYKNIPMKPSENDGYHILRIKLKNAPINAKIQFCQKFFKGRNNEWKFSDFHNQINEPIQNSGCSTCSDGVYTFKSKSRINITEGFVTKEQIGIYFDASDMDYDCTIEEAYNGIESNIYNINLCRFHIVSIFVSKRI